MPVNALTNPETLQDFELAAQDRYWEGLELMVAGREPGGVYLLGYTAEMLLKLASFRLESVRPTDPVKPRLAPVRQWMKQTCPGIDSEGFHSLVFWATYLRTKRRQQGRPLDPLTESQLAERTRCLYAVWTVEMRYRSLRRPASDWRSAYDSVEWIRENYLRLWR